MVKLDAERQEELGLAVLPLGAYSYKPEVCAVGRLEADPAGVFVLRAPVAGVLRIAEGTAWTRLGDPVDRGAIVGWIEPRLSPLEQADLASRRAAARSEQAQAEADLSAAEASFENKRALNTENKIVTDRALEEARAKVAGQQARSAASQEIVRLIEAAQGAHGPTRENELRVELTGEVVDLSVQAGETVDRGQILFRVTNFDTLLARIELPVGVAYDENVAAGRITPLDREHESLSAERVAQTPRIDGAPGGVVLLYRIEARGKPFRPGERVLAYVATATEEESGVLIPRDAVVRDSGRAWVYVRKDEDTFVRREVPTTAPTPEGWFAAAGFSAGDEVVMDGALILLSEELKPQIEKEEAAED